MIAVITPLIIEEVKMMAELILIAILVLSILTYRAVKKNDKDDN